jgi:hypothetical protein
MKKLAYISVNRQIIARNARHGTKEPAISVRIGKSGKPRYVRSLKINGPSKLLYDPSKPILKCGARLVIITEAEHVL